MRNIIALQCLLLLALAAWPRALALPVNISTVHFISGNHLALGYTGTDDAIINEYFTKFFPRAVSIPSRPRAQWPAVPGSPKGDGTP